MGGIWYATIEQVKSSLDVALTSRDNWIVAQKLDATTDVVHGLLHKRFYPERKTVTFDWPNRQYAYSWQLWLGDNELISIESMTSGGVTIPADDRFLRRTDDKDEPPYNLVEIDLDSASALQSGNTPQRSISILGLYGEKDTDTSLPSGSLGGNINSSVTSLVINPSGGRYTVGIGSIVLIGTERLILTERSMSDTGQNLATAMTDHQSDTVLDVADASGFAINEIVALSPERMRITDIIGNNLIVDRGWDGTVLSEHTAPKDVYALRTFTAKRGQLGSTAASHSTSDPVYAHEFGLVNELAIAEATVLCEQATAGYARVVGAGANARESGGQGLNDVRERAVMAYGRKSRLSGI